MEDEFVQASTPRRQDTLEDRAWATWGPNQNAAISRLRSSPTVDGERLYALGSDGDLACLETSTGKLVWQKNLVTDFGGKTGVWAYAESPLVDGDVLVCTPGGNDATSSP